MWLNSHETAELVTFTEEIFNEKLLFLCCMDKLGFFVLFGPIFKQARSFSKNLAPPVQRPYGPTTSFKVLKETNELILR